MLMGCVICVTIYHNVTSISITTCHKKKYLSHMRAMKSILWNKSKRAYK